MIPPPFDYYTPASLEEALKLLGEVGGEGRVLAGGQSLIPMLKLRLVRPRVLIDLFRINGMDYVREEKGRLQIGALATEREIESSPLVKKACPILSEAAACIGDIHVRNLGTVGGSLCHADPAADLPVTLLALEAALTAESRKGKRVLNCRDFFNGPFATSLADDEMLTQIEIPKWNGKTSGAYIKLTRKAGDFAIVGAAVVVGLDEKKRCQRCRIALCGVGPEPFLSERAAQALLGSGFTDNVISEVSELAKEGAQPFSDVHASSEYRREMIPVVVCEALRLAKERLEVAQ